MKLSLILSVATTAFFARYASASTKPVFSFDDNRAFLVLSNLTTADGDFFWQKISADATTDGKTAAKELATPASALKIQCKREVQRPANTTCVFAFAKSVSADEVVSVSRLQKRMGVRLSGASAVDFLSRLVPGPASDSSPDGRMKIEVEADSVSVSWGQ